MRERKGKGRNKKEEEKTKEEGKGRAFLSIGTLGDIDRQTNTFRLL